MMMLKAYFDFSTANLFHLLFKSSCFAPSLLCPVHHILHFPPALVLFYDHLSLKWTAWPIAIVTDSHDRWR